MRPPRTRANLIIPRPPSETMTALAAEAKRRGISLGEISRRTGIPKGRLSEYLRGVRRPSIDKAEIIAAAIGVRLVTKPLVCRTVSG